jgi:site-specific recombinase XerD
MYSLNTLINDFERSMVRRELSPRTIEAYHWAFLSLLKNLGSVELTRDLLENWQDSMIDHGLSPKSRHLAITAVRQLIRYAVDKELIDHRLEKALAKVKVPDGQPHPISKENLTKIKDYLLPFHSKMTLSHLCNRALFFYLLTTGARISEVLQVCRDNFKNPQVIQKGGSPKTLLTTPLVENLIQEYLVARNDNLPWCWIHCHNDKLYHLMTPSDARRVWHKLSNQLEIPYWTTHSIRHTCATELLEAGIPELVIASHLGHHGLGSLHIYGQVRDKQKQEAIIALEKLLS